MLHAYELTNLLKADHAEKPLFNLAFNATDHPDQLALP